MLPTAVLEQTSGLIHHLTTTPVHAYFPYARFPVLHAVRVAVVWAGLTRGRMRKVGYLGDLFGYLVMACMYLLSSSTVYIYRSCRSMRARRRCDVIVLVRGADQQGADQQ